MIKHVPVLLQESLQALNVKPDGIYVDATYGGGGHSKEILKKLKTGKLVVFDMDADAMENTEAPENMIMIRQNFKHLKRYLQLHNLIPVDGILADLGISSHQIDTPARGFTYREDAPLDMRMSSSGALTAADVLNEYPEDELVKIFSAYGEVENSKRLAKAIAEARTNEKIKSVAQLKKVMQPLIKGNENKYLSKVFQALRIEVNKELESLKDLLQQSAEVLKEGGRLAVISYHSLEDRLVKDFMRAGNFEGEAEKDVFGNTKVPFRELKRKPVTPSQEEIKSNRRARSAKLRVAEKTENI